MKKEVEVKAQLRDRAMVERNLLSQGCVFSGPIIQDDVIFIKEGQTLADIKRTKDIVLRIRSTEEKILLTLKKARTNELDVIEHEVTIDRADQMREILALLGFVELLRIRKKR